jgi:hypothetical protein
MKLFNRFIPFFVICFFLFQGAVRADSARGYKAEVTDSNGFVTAVSEFRFKTYFSITDTTVFVGRKEGRDWEVFDIPVNDKCGRGALMIPISEVASVSDISDHHAVITLTNGKILRSNFGSFAKYEITDAVGKTELGDYKINVKKIRKIVFHHKKNVHLNLKTWRWIKPKGHLEATLTCKSGKTISLKHVWTFVVSRPYPEWGGKKEPVLHVNISDSEQYVKLAKLARIVVGLPTTDKGTTFKLTLRTKAGSTVDALLNDKYGIVYMGGFTDEGWFYFVKLSDLKEIFFQ